MANGDVVFFGTAAIGLPILKELNKNFGLRLVVTQPDRRGGRNRQLLVPAVKQFALENRLPFCSRPTCASRSWSWPCAASIRPSPWSWPTASSSPGTSAPCPAIKTVNVHFSLLPAYRGAAPVQRAIQNGESRSGITIFEISGRMDAGPVWAREEIAIRPDDTTASYQQRLGERAAPFLRQTLEQIFAGTIRQHPQDDSQASQAPPLDKKEGRVNWQLPAQRLYDRLRAFTPWPGLFFHLEKQQVKILSAGSFPEKAPWPGQARSWH